MFDIYTIGKNCYKSLHEHPYFIGFSNNPNDEGIYVDKCKDAEEYELNFTPPERKNDNIIIFSEAYEDLNGVMLKLLENYSGKKYVIFLIKENNLNNKQIINQKIFCNVLQEYSRAGYIDRVFLISINKIIEKMVVDIFDIDNQINVFIGNMLNLLLFMEFEEPLYGKKFETSQVNKISTFGHYNQNNINYLYDLTTSENCQKHYVVIISRNDPESRTLIQKMDKLIQGNSSSYEIHSSEDETTTFVLLSTNVIQEF